MSNGPTIALPASQLPFFFTDLRLIADPANREMVQKALDALGTYTGAGSDIRQGKMEADLASSVSSDQWTARRVFQMLAVLSSSLAVGTEEMPPDQAVTQIIALLQSTAGDNKELQLSAEVLGRLETLLVTVAERSGRVKQEADDQSVARGVLPMFEDLKATLELRSLQWPLVSDSDNIGQLSRLTPIASLSLQLDTGNPSTIYFQATEADLASMLDKLQRLQVTLLKLKQIAAAVPPPADV